MSQVTSSPISQRPILGLHTAGTITPLLVALQQDPEQRLPSRPLLLLWPGPGFAGAPCSASGPPNIPPGFSLQGFQNLDEPLHFKQMRLYQISRLCSNSLYPSLMN